MANQLTITKRTLIRLMFIVYSLELVSRYIGASYERLTATSLAYQQLGRTSTLVLILRYILLFLVMLCFFMENQKKKTLLSSFIFSIMLIMGVLFWLVNSYSEIGEVVFYNTVSSLVYLTVFGFAIGKDAESFHFLTEMCGKFGIVYLIASIACYLSFISMYPTGVISNSATMVLFVNAFWMSAIFTLYNVQNERKRVYCYILIALTLFMSLIITSRSWIIQSLVLLIVFVLATAENKKKVAGRIFLLIIVGSLLLVLASRVMQTYFSVAWEFLQAKMGNDTRSQQLIDFFGVVSFKDLIVGRGDTFRYETIYANYAYIDNGFLFILIRYGIVVFLPYLYFIFIRPMNAVLKKRSEFPLLFAVIIMWCCALGGLSVYNVVGIDIKSIIVPAVAGYLFYCQKSNEGYVQ